VTGVPLYVLAGGRSRRFGSEKARALVAGQPLVRAAMRPLEPLASCVTVIGRHPGQYADLGLETIGDAVPDRGPLGGLHRALQHLNASSDPWLLLAPCDVIGLRTCWVRELLDAASCPVVQAVAYRGRRWQPLPALYHRTLLDEVEQRVRAGRSSLWRLIQAVPHRALPLPASWGRVVQVNAPADLEQIEFPGR
jgi:molybdopterin-guanine dinucleotide biosynthesis protein A